MFKFKPQHVQLASLVQDVQRSVTVQVDHVISLLENVQVAVCQDGQEQVVSVSIYNRLVQSLAQMHIHDW